ncbi:Peroxin [Zostera marina]|uniref:Peroxin n=1 Tax=Zostera marina TaxID=29655 RepID=A0A0K9PLS7_ZOSMR|nr:Peroxin [Zostera marina]
MNSDATVMAQSMTEQIVSLARRTSSLIGRKLSSAIVLVFNNKNAGSFGALAGFTLAIVFAWKFMRSPDRPPRRRRRNTPPTSNNGLASVEPSNSEVYPQLLNAKDLDAIQAFDDHANFTLGQVVRKKLNGGRKVTCQLLGILLEEKSSIELQAHATFKLSVLEVLSELSRTCDLYLMETVEDDESEERVLAALQDVGVFKTGGLVREKVLFCGTENGRSSFVRQLEPDWHIDTNPVVVSNLTRFIRYQLHISSAVTSSVMASNVSTSSSLEKFFSF